MNRHLIFLLCICRSCFAQIYPTSLQFNGCSYDYNGYISPDSIACHTKTLKLVWEDNFDSTGINLSRWRTSYPWGRALHSDRYGTGFDQTYALDENVSTHNGFLFLHMKEDSTLHPSPDDPSQIIPFNYSSGMLYENSGHGYGKYEIRCKIPKIEGIWPAFWMYGFCAQELDVFEFINLSEDSDPNYESGNMIMTYHRQYDCKDTSKGACNNGFTRYAGKDLSLDFHTYSLEWDEYKIVWKLDDEVMREVYRLWVLSSPLPEGSLIASAYPIKSCLDLNPSTKYCQFTAFPIDENQMHVIVGGSVALKKHVVVPKDFIVDHIKVYSYSDESVAVKNKNVYDFDSYPNPAHSELTLPEAIWGRNLSSFEIVDAVGTRINATYKLYGDLRVYDLSAVPPGILIVKAKTTSEVFIKKIIHY
jgi:hypothetical protein